MCGRIKEQVKMVACPGFEPTSAPAGSMILAVCLETKHCLQGRSLRLEWMIQRVRLTTASDADDNLAAGRKKDSPISRSSARAYQTGLWSKGCSDLVPPPLQFRGHKKTTATPVYTCISTESRYPPLPKRPGIGGIGAGRQRAAARPPDG